MDKVRERILEYITKGIVKSEAIKKLKKEFGGTEKELSDLWISVKEENKINRNRSGANTIIKENKKEIEESPKLKLKRIELEGEFGSYVREGNKVTTGKMTFNSLEELEEYQIKEIEIFNKKIQEIREVYKIG